MKYGKGFTLIELVVVITIIGILAAVALPRYINLQKDSRIAKLNAARGAVGAAAALVHSAFLTRGGVADTAPCPGVTPVATATNTTNICTESGLVLIANGYPTAALGGIVSAAGLTSVFPATAAALAADGFATGTPTAPVTGLLVEVTGGAAVATCSFAYSPPAAAGAASVVSAINTAGC